MDIFTALAEPTRRSIVGILAERGELSATDISAKFDSSPPAISQHLKVLREADVVSIEKRGRQRFYRLNPAGIDEIDRWVRQTKKSWDTRLDRLDRFLSSTGKKSRTKK